MAQNLEQGIGIQFHPKEEAVPRQVGVRQKPATALADVGLAMLQPLFCDSVRPGLQ